MIHAVSFVLLSQSIGALLTDFLPRVPSLNPRYLHYRPDLTSPEKILSNEHFVLLVCTPIYLFNNTLFSTS